jgi:hypothetical protein
MLYVGWVRNYLRISRNFYIIFAKFWRNIATDFREIKQEILQHFAKLKEISWNNKKFFANKPTVNMLILKSN